MRLLPALRFVIHSMCHPLLGHRPIVCRLQMSVGQVNIEFCSAHTLMSEQGLWDGIAFLLKEFQEPLKGTQVGVDGGGSVLILETLIREIQQMLAFDVRQFSHSILLTQEAP